MLKRLFNYLFVPPGLRKDEAPNERARKVLIVRINILALAYAYYVLKDQARTDEQGSFSLWRHLTGKPQHEPLTGLSDDDLRGYIPDVADLPDNVQEMLAQYGGGLGWVDPDGTVHTKVTHPLPDALDVPGFVQRDQDLGH